jgi:hypothetical protein
MSEPKTVSEWLLQQAETTRDMRPGPTLYDALHGIAMELRELGDAPMPKSADGRRYLAAADFRTDGYLQEANRLFFHPLGLALELLGMEGRTLLNVWDARSDPEGFCFARPADDLEFVDKANRIASIENDRREARERSLGFWIQPAIEP